MTMLLRAIGVAVAGRLQPTSLALQRGTLTALIGPNGGGKTSLLRALAGIEHSSGIVEIEGERLERTSPARRRSLLAFLPASRDVTWPIAVRDVIALGLDAPNERRVSDLIGLLELGPLADRPIDRLSTGERARVLLARALAARPRLLLLDEPLSNLDPYWVLRTMGVIKSAMEDGAAALVSLHDLSLLQHFGRTLLVNRGKVIAEGSPTEVLADRTFNSAFRVRQSPAGWEVAP